MSRKSRTMLAIPYAPWATFALRYGEMMFASQQVIAHRVSRMLAAGHRPGARDRREFARMYSEKGDAAWRSLMGMWGEMANFNQQLLLQSMRAAAFAPFTLRAGRRGAARSHGSRQASLAGERLAIALAQAALKPVHAKATANARRLGRRTK
jgi:hypothetical protein